MDCTGSTSCLKCAPGELQYGVYVTQREAALTTSIPVVYGPSVRMRVCVCLLIAGEGRVLPVWDSRLAVSTLL